MTDTHYDADMELGSMVDAFADEIAQSLATGVELQDSRAFQSVAAALASDAMENLKAVEAASMHASPVRNSVFAAVKSAVAGKIPAAATFLKVDAAECSAGAPPVRADVRDTGAREVYGGVFTFGRSDTCDVQVFGDETVLPVQIIAISLPGGTIVADFASAGGTEVVGRGCGGAEPIPVLGGVCLKALVVRPGDRIVLQVGDRSTISLQPRTASSPLDAWKERMRSYTGPVSASFTKPTSRCQRSRSSHSYDTGVGLSKISICDFSDVESVCSESAPRNRSRSPRRRLVQSMQL